MRGEFSAVLSYIIIARISNIDSVTAILVRDADERYATSIFALALELNDFIELPLGA